MDTGRAVEVIARPTDSNGKAGYGSGYHLGGDLVVTCAHLLPEGPHRLTVRDRERREIPVSVAWCNRTHDVALLRLDGSHALPEGTVALAKLWPASAPASVSFEMYGWPKSGDDLDGRGARVRDPVLVDGEIKITEFLAAPSGMLRLRPREHYEPLENSSFWSGMSGAAVLVAGDLVGVQIRQQDRQLTAYLAARPLTSEVLDHRDSNGVSGTELLAAAGIRTGIQVAGRALARDVFIQVQNLPPRPPPSFLLRSGYEVVPFRGRRRELADLTTWCETDDEVGLRLCVAAGGQGKTRLAQHLVHRLAERGWLAGRLRPHCGEESLAELLQVPGQVLAVVDYAETQPERLERLLELLAEPRPPGSRLRMLLLARSAGEWWEEIQRQAPDSLAILLDGTVLELPAMFERAADRQAGFEAAVTAFARTGGYRVEGLAPPEDLDDDRYAHALTLHMTALATLLDHQQGEDGGEAARLDPAKRVLHHEQRYWAAAAQAMDLPHDRPRLLDAVMTAATCCGAATRNEAMDVLSHLPDLVDEHPRVLGLYADWVRQLHPGDAWLNPLEPDLLGEYFITRTLRAQEDLGEALAHAATSNKQRLRLITVLAAAGQRYALPPSLVRRILEAGDDGLWTAGALRAVYLDEPEAMIRPLLQTLTTVQDPGFLRWTAIAIPGVYRVSELKIATADEALRRYRALPSRDLAAEADAMDARSSGLAFAGRHDEARKSLRTLVRLYEKMAKQDPQGRALDLARARLNYGTQLVGTDQTREALDLANKIISAVSAIPEQDRPEMLSNAYDLRALAFKDLKRPGKAVKASERAVREGRTAALTSKTARAWQPMKLMNLANRYSEAGRHQDALETIQEAIRQGRLLKANHHPLSPTMADLLFNYAQCLRDCGRIADAREAFRDVVTRLRPLAVRHLMFRRKLGMAVGQWALCLLESPFDQERDHNEYRYVIGLLTDLSDLGPRLRIAYFAAMLDYGTKLLKAGDDEQGKQWINKAMRSKP